MGNQVIGLDIGTHAVRAVELSFGRGRPALRRMGQVALPPGAVVAGEVMVPTLVAAALRRLWAQVGFRSRRVVVGVANARVVARMTELPDLPEGELRSSLPYQVQELIPIPVEEAELDFQVVERVQTPDGEARLQVLLVAAHRDMLRSLLRSLEAANLTPARIDLIPFALIRALHDPMAWATADDHRAGPDVIIGSGAGVTNIVVHEHGLPRFVRTLPTGGSLVTEAIAEDLGVEADEAEAVKRSPDAETRVDDLAVTSLAPLAREVADSLDFHLAQVNSADQLRGVVLSGGSGRLPALRSILEEHLGVQVVDGDPYARVDLSHVRLDPAVVLASADYFTVAIGLALSGEPAVRDVSRITLLPAEISAQRAQRHQLVLVGAGVVACGALLLGLSVSRSQEVDSERLAALQAEDRANSLDRRIGSLAEIERLQQDIASRTATLSTTLAGDVAWPSLFHELTAALPPDVWVTGFSASAGQIQLQLAGTDHTSTARWLQRVEEVDGLGDVWLVNSTKGAAGGAPVQFSATASVVADDATPRLARYVGSGR